MNTITKYVALAIALIGVALTAGCSPKGNIRTEQVNDVLVEALTLTHNERVEEIERLWARVSVRIKGSDANGKSFEEQGEGHLQVTRPDQVSLVIGKLGETYFAYGSNTDQYWMYDLSNSDRRVALIGAVENITPDRADQIGLSVHPGDLIASLGIEPIDPDRIIESRWVLSEELVVIAQSSRWGISEYWFDPSTGLVMQVLSLDGDGRVIARTGLSRYKEMLDDQKRGTGVMVPGKVEITREGAGSQGEFVRIELSEPSQKMIRSMVYNPARLSRVYRVHETIDLDQ
ncbi:MAG: hypothetical protein AB8C13_02390 [Phycisphaerales bacterium]